jgi:hypothetical protein
MRPTSGGLSAIIVVAGESAMAERKKFTLTVEGAVNGKQVVFVEADGVRIARRTYAKWVVPLEPWVSLEPGWEVQGEPQNGEYFVSYKGVRVQ